MSSIQLELPFGTLISSLQQLNAEELTELAQHAARLGARRRAPSLTQAETDLILKINQDIEPISTTGCSTCSLPTPFSRPTKRRSG